VTDGGGLRAKLLPGARALLRAHAEELPQRDDLCGAFCGALALRAAAIERAGDEPVDQDTVALAAGSIVSDARDPGTLPAGETGRRDYRLAIPGIDDPDISGTTAAGVLQAIAEVSGGALVPVPLSGPWTAQTLSGIFELALGCEEPVTLIANLATHHLWGGRPSAAELLDQLCDGGEEGPPPDWDVGHFTCILGRIDGPGGSLYVVADTYPALGNRGIHLQPTGRLAAAIDRRDKPAGGIIAVVGQEEAARIREGAAGLGLREEIWDNGTVTGEAAP
jgi:hypothetical protein